MKLNFFYNQWTILTWNYYFKNIPQVFSLEEPPLSRNLKHYNKHRLQIKTQCQISITPLQLFVRSIPGSPKHYKGLLMVLVAHQNLMVRPYCLKTSHAFLRGHKQIKLVCTNQELPIGFLSEYWKVLFMLQSEKKINYFAQLWALWLTEMPSVPRYVHRCILYITQEEVDRLKPWCPVRKTLTLKKRVPLLVTHNWVTGCKFPAFCSIVSTEL